MSEKIELKLPNGKDYLSYSSSSKLAEHPMTYLNYINDKFIPSPEMEFGTYYEALLYQDQESLSNFFIYNDEAVVERAIKKYGKETKSIRNTNVYKEERERVLKEAEGKIIITEEQHHSAIHMGTIMQDSGLFGEYLVGENQKVIKKVIDTGKYIVKALVKVDNLRDDGLITDLKTTSKVIPRFKRDALLLNYDIQAYLSMEVGSNDEFPFVVQRTQGLYDVGLFTARRDGYFFESGRNKFNRAIDNYVKYISPEAQILGAEPTHYIYQSDL